MQISTKLKRILIIVFVIVFIAFVVIMSVFFSEDKFQLKYLKPTLMEKYGYDDVYTISHLKLAYLKSLGLIDDVNVKFHIDDRCAILLANKDGKDKLLVLSQSNRFELVEHESPFSFTSNYFVDILNNNSLIEGKETAIWLNISEPKYANAFGLEQLQCSQFALMLDVNPATMEYERYIAFDYKGKMVIYDYKTKELIYDASKN